MEKSYEKYLDEAVKKFQEGMSVLAAKTDELTQKGKIKFEVLAIKREIDKNFTELGKEIFNLKEVQNDAAPLEDTKVANLFENIKSLNEKLEAKKAEYVHVAKKEEGSDEKSESDAEFV